MDVTELIKKLYHSKKVKIYPIDDENWFDVGQWSNYKNTLNNFATSKIETNE